MALVPMRLMLDHAAENGYGIPAYNVNNLEQILAIMRAADETNSPVILQASRGARSYAGEYFLRHLIQAAVESYPHIPIAHAPRSWECSFYLLLCHSPRFHQCDDGWFLGS